MSREPSFDELVGAEPMGAERERLRHVHDLLLQAGAPAELPPALARAPQLGGDEATRRRQAKRRALLLVAAALVTAGVFAAGYGVGHIGGGQAGGQVLALKGTSAAPHARATLDVLPASGGNWPMKLVVDDLPTLPARGYYAVFLVRNGHYLSCGTFVTAGGSGPLTVTLNAPYRLRAGDRWVVTRETPQVPGHGPTVLRPA